MLSVIAAAIPLFPLLAAVIITVLGPTVLRERSHRVCLAALGLSLLGSLCLLLAEPGDVGPRVYSWLQVGGLNVDIVWRTDALTNLMLTTVNFVALLVATYSIGYMHHDPGYPRFFAALSLFVFAMCGLVLAGNFILLYVFWELVGFCSYLLIGFWYQKPAAAGAARKAFLVNRVGDFGFLLGIFLIWRTFGTLDFAAVFAHAADVDTTTLTTICLLLFVGAIGKSAQFPLHVWLPDAMEGPTPASALIHAATMVTAGVYMVARCTPLFVLAPTAQLVVAGIGAITALLAALIALTQNDLKRVLAYSTVSQLGYMFMALGGAAGDAELASFAVIVAVFHLFTHAFFKALLFLAAGNVMHAMGNVIDMRRFGGLRHRLYATHLTFLCGAVALSGLPPFSGFWSKDEILQVLHHGGHHEVYGSYFKLLFAIGSVTAFLTAFYTFRAYFMTFWGTERLPPEAAHHGEESPPVMVMPLLLLALLALSVGFLSGPTGWLAGYLARSVDLPPLHHHDVNWSVAVGGSLLAVLGIFLAWLFYTQWPQVPARIAAGIPKWYQLSQERFLIDEFYQAVVVGPIWKLAKICAAVDRDAIDLLVDLVGWIPGILGRRLRPWQNGMTQSYALATMAGLALLLVATLWSLGTS